MAYAREVYEVSASAGQSQFDVPFPYLQPTHVKVRIDGVETTDFSFVNPARIELVTAAPLGAVVVVSRETSPDVRLVDYQTGSVLSEEILDIDSLQGFYLSQEANDVKEIVIARNAFDQWEGSNRKLQNLADPVDAQDAVTKGYMENTWLTPSDKSQLNSLNLNNLDTVAGSVGNVNTVAGSITNVNTTATNITNVNKVAAVDAKVTTVANNDANVTTVANSINSVNTTAGSITNVNTTAGSIINVNTVGNNIANVNTVAGVSANVTKVANIDTKVTTVANNDTNVSTVAGISGNVTTVAGIAGNVTTVATNNANVTAVANNAANINAAVANQTNINAAVSNASNINAVVSNATNINTVASNNANVTTVATNIAAVLDAPNQASAAAASAVSAASSAATAAALLDNFDDRYLGAKASDPATDNDGNALIVGALYFNTTDGVMSIYTSSGWIAASSASVATLATFEFVATAGQTVFSGADANGVSLSYTAPALMVTLNGVRLRPDDDYTATDGVNITLVSAATAGDELVVDAFGNFLVADTYSKAQTDALIGAVDLTSRVAKTGDTMTGALLMQTSNELQFWTSNYGIRASTGLEIKTGDMIRFLNGTTEQMKIDTAGRVTMPYQPCFHGRQSNTTTYGTNAIFVADQAKVNIGNCYNTSNGLFTAPVAGVYQVTGSFLGGSAGTTASYINMMLRINGAADSSYGAIYGSATTEINIAGTFFVPLNAGDTVAFINMNNGNQKLYGSESFMAVRLIG